MFWFRWFRNPMQRSRYQKGERFSNSFYYKYRRRSAISSLNKNGTRDAVPSLRGLLGAWPPKQSSKTPNWNMKHYKSAEILSIWQFLECQVPLNKPKAPRRHAKSPYGKVSGDGSAEMFRRRASYWFYHRAFISSSSFSPAISRKIIWSQLVAHEILRSAK